MKRTIYLSIFVALSGIAGLLYYNHTRQATAIVAARDLAVGATIQDSDVTVRSVNPTSLGGQVLRSPDQAIGQLVKVPILQGEFVDARQLGPITNVAVLTSGTPLPPGERIIGLPVSPAAAVGGVLKPGDRVDVMAIGNASKNAALTEEPPAPPVLLGKNVMVVGLRTDQGTPADSTDHGPNAGLNRPTSVLLAIPLIDEAAYSAAIASSTFVLTLSTD